MYDNVPTIGQQRHIISRDVIKRFSQSDKPLDRLACALAFINEGASYRKEAIVCLEFYFQHPVRLPEDNGRPYFSEWQLHSYLSALYEKEYLFTKAIEQLEYCQKCKNQNPYIEDFVNPADYTRVADIIVKRDNVDKAIEYIESLKNQKVYKKIKHSVDCKYNELLEKKKKGYVYKPKKKED